MQSFDKLDSNWRQIIFDEIPIALALVSPNHRFARSNDAFCELVGYSRSELAQRTWQSITHPDDVAGDQSGADRLKVDASSDTYTVTKRYLHKCGHSIWVNLYVRAVWNNGQFLCYYIIAIPSQEQPSSAPSSPSKPSLIEWCKANPRDTFLMISAASLLLGRDSVLEIIKAYLLK